MLLRHRGHTPTVDPTAYIAPTAVVSGDVIVGPSCRVLFGAVLTSEGGRVELGARCIVMENAVLRGTPGHPTRIGDNVLIGPGAHLSGCRVGPDCFIATRATIFNGAVLEAGVEVRVGGTVQVNTRMLADTSVPIGWVAVGDPAAFFPPDRHDQISAIQRELNFTRTVFHLDRDAPQPEVAERYARALGLHLQDSIVDGPGGNGPSQQRGERRGHIDTDEFAALIERLAEAWEAQDTDRAVGCFDPDATYMEPPDIQCFRGHAELRRYFDALLPRTTMRWQRVWFDEARQRGAGEFIFGSVAAQEADHGVAIMTLRNGRIGRWEEYQRRGPRDTEIFLASEGKDWRWHGGNYG
jgi:carbonic anhydrase/acetyltransferase-like protein (isoleucine patch superfamily)